MSDAPMLVSIIMPALNEAKNIEAAIATTLQAFNQLHLSGEIIVINDGSTDPTGALVADQMAQDSRLKLITHAQPAGIGASFWDGVAQAQGEIVVMLPGDNENDPLETLRYAGLLEHVDMVIPFVYNREVRSFFRNALSLLYRQIINTTFRTAFHYTNGTVFYRRSALNTCDHRSVGFFFQTEILIKLVNAGYLFAEVPYRLSPRRGGASKAVSLRSLVKVVSSYLQLMHDVYFSTPPASAGLTLSPDSATFKRRTAPKSPDR